MLARLVGYSSDPFPEDVPTWRFDIVVSERNHPELTATLSLGGVVFIVESSKQGPIYQLCRAIRDARGNTYDSLVGVEFGSD
ncbi:hypothetical protein SBC2_77380 (plasmid) [Caballeronia sp. SBC2]|nr:hypothetical protein SBC2_77380 [Caballeronia sp. SBC2]